jgi:hypothetical protein
MYPIYPFVSIEICRLDRQLQELGHEVIVANVRELQANFRADPGETSSASSEIAMWAVTWGWRPRRNQSGDRDPQLGITKAGNVYLRSLLIDVRTIAPSPDRDQLQNQLSAAAQ